jgi:ribonuclease D
MFMQRHKVIDIAVSIAVLAAAKKDDQVKREEQARQREEERRLRELALRRDHIAERRGKALDEVLEEMASLDRLRRLVANLRGEEMSGSIGRVTEFLGLAERRLASREAALSTDGLEQRFEKQKLFGDDDDHAFRPPYGYY